MRAIPARVARRVGLLVAVASMILISVATPAMGSSKATAAATIHAKTDTPVVTGDVWTVYAAGKYSKATITGVVTGAPARSTIKLEARPFPYKSSPKTVREAVLSSTGHYSFTVQPSFATKYWVTVFPLKSDSPITTSSKITVYVAPSTSFLSPVTSCNTAGNRPVCHQSFTLAFRAPASVLYREGHKHIYSYFGLRLSSTGEPPPPRELKLVTFFIYSSLVKVSSTEYKFHLHFSFKVGKDGYYFAINLCTKDTESADGMGLPGHHSCGDTKIPRNIKYLG
jgi:hypothetical protein